jgi:hypothetical protein
MRRQDVEALYPSVETYNRRALKSCWRIAKGTHLVCGFVFAHKACRRSVLAQEFQQNQKAECMNFSGRTYAQYPKPSCHVWFVEPIAHLGYELSGRVHYELLMVLADRIFRAFVTHQNQRGNDDVAEGGFQTMLIAITNDKRASASLIKLEQPAVIFVIIALGVPNAQQNRQKAKRRNVIARHL